MIRNIHVLFLLLLFLFSGCIKSYIPQIDGDAEHKYVVSGLITDQEGWQEVEVSLSSPVQSPEFIPVQGCTVRVFDDKGNTFEFGEYAPGKYRAWMKQPELAPGTTYRMTVLTPEGETLASGSDRMAKAPAIDSVYYNVEHVPTADPTQAYNVAQFYIDLNAIGDYSQYYKWEIDETWEYHAALPAEYYYDGTTHEIRPPDSSNMICYTSAPVKNVFTLSTKSLFQNAYKKFKLHAVDGKTSRLGYHYSILVRQLAVSEGAYNYWEQMRINSNDQGGLYEKQPLSVRGNITSLTNPEKSVHGYFYAASVTTRRYFFQDIPGVELAFFNFCSPYPMGRFGWRELEKSEYPVFFYYNENGALRLLNPECVDCRKLGGTTVKPDFWPF